MMERDANSQNGPLHIKSNQNVNLHHIIATNKKYYLSNKPKITYETIIFLIKIDNLKFQEIFR